MNELALSGYAHCAGPWPASLPGLGSFVGGQRYSRCIFCPPAKRLDAYTFGTYGGKPVCLACARERGR
jgi:hypothetical protein